MHSNKATTLGLDEDDLRAFALVHEVHRGEDVVDLGDEIVLCELEHVQRHLAAVELSACVIDHCPESPAQGPVAIR